MAAGLTWRRAEPGRVIAQAHDRRASPTPQAPSDKADADAVARPASPGTLKRFATGPSTVRGMPSLLPGFGHAVSDAALVEDPDGVGRVVTELGADLLDEGAHALGVGGLA